MKKLLLFALLFLTLGCASTAPLEAPVSDDELAARVQKAINSDLDLMQFRISVSALKGTVVLSGYVPTDKHRDKAAFVAAGVSGVRGVVNDLVVN
jgi:osmotically-inducible protein OsmY